MVSVDWPGIFALWCVPSVAIVAAGVFIALADGLRRPVVAGLLAVLGGAYLALVVQFALRIDLLVCVPLSGFYPTMVHWHGWDVLFAVLEAGIAVAMVLVAALGEREAA